MGCWSACRNRRVKPSGARRRGGGDEENTRRRLRNQTEQRDGTLSYSVVQRAGLARRPFPSSLNQCRTCGKGRWAVFRGRRRQPALYLRNGVRSIHPRYRKQCPGPAHDNARPNHRPVRPRHRRRLFRPAWCNTVRLRTRPTPFAATSPPICNECGRPVSWDIRTTPAWRGGRVEPRRDDARRHYRAAIVLSLAFAAALFVLSRSWHGLVAGILLCVLMFGLAEAAAWARVGVCKPRPCRPVAPETLVLQRLWVLGARGSRQSISERRNSGFTRRAAVVARFILDRADLRPSSPRTDSGCDWKLQHLAGPAGAPAASSSMARSSPGCWDCSSRRIPPCGCRCGRRSGLQARRSEVHSSLCGHLTTQHEPTSPARRSQRTICPRCSYDLSGTQTGRCSSAAAPTAADAVAAANQVQVSVGVAN